MKSNEKNSNKVNDFEKRIDNLENKMGKVEDIDHIKESINNLNPLITKVKKLRFYIGIATLCTASFGYYCLNKDSKICKCGTALEDLKDDQENLDEKLRELGIRFDNAEDHIEDLNNEISDIKNNLEEEDSVDHLTIPNPTEAPVLSPSPNPTKAPISSPSPNPTKAPISSPSPNPTKAPVLSPSPNPTEAPISSPSPNPTEAPVLSPSPNPTEAPTVCEHDFFEQEKQDATCTKDGYVKLICKKCSEKVTNVLNQLGHKIKFIQNISATCTEKGYELYKCTTCGEEEKRNETNALGHTEGRVVTTIDGDVQTITHYCDRCDYIMFEETSKVPGGTTDQDSQPDIKEDGDDLEVRNRIYQLQYIMKSNPILADYTITYDEPSKVKTYHI